MPENPIKYRDFIEPDDSIVNLISQLERAGQVYEEQIKKLGAEAAKTETSIKKMSSATLEGQEAIKQGAVEVDKLAKAEDKLRESQSSVGIELAKLREVQKEQNRLTALETKLNQAKEGSYDRLSAQYSLNKIKLNAMSAAQRQGTQTGRELEKQTKKIYAEMNKMQIATGKHTLQVGNYGKAYNGLNTSVNQLTRELPVLGMNLNTFFLAISNNIPMLIDEVDRLRIANKAALEQGKTSIPVGKQVMKAVLSWQTALSVGVALLTIYGKDLVEWIGRLGKGSDAISEMAEAQKKLNEVTEEGLKKAVKERAELELLYSTSQDNTKSYEERVKAVQLLKKEWPEYFKNLSDENILAGKAADSYTRLAEAIVKTAQARAAQDKMIENYKRLIEIQFEAEELNEKINESLAKGNQAYSKATIRIAGTGKEIAKLQKIRKESLELVAQNEELAKRLSIEELFGGGEKGAKAVDSTLKLMQQVTDSYLALREEGVEKEIALLKTKHEREKEALVEKYGEEAKNKELLNTLLLNLDKKYIQDVDALYRKNIERMKKEDEEKLKLLEEESKNRYSAALDSYDQEYELRLSEIDLLKTTEAEKTKLKLAAERDRLQKILDLNATADRQLSDMQIEAVKNTISKINQEILEVRDKNIDIYSMLGFNLDNEQKKAIKESFKLSIQQLEYFMDSVLEAADKRVAAADDDVAASKSVLDAEIEARNNGYAYSVTAAQKELNLAKKTQAKAIQEQKKAQKAQLALESISQASNLITASAKIWATLPFPFAIPALAVMWGSFTAAKLKAAQVTKQSYGEGGSEFLEGGSHASGRDIHLGMTSDGKDRRAEGGEFLGIVNKNKTRRYRKVLPKVIDSFNKGTFEERYGGAYNINRAGTTIIHSSTDVRALEKDVGAIRKQGEKTFFVDGKGRMIEKYRNLTRIHNVN